MVGGEEDKLDVDGSLCGDCLFYEIVQRTAGRIGTLFE